MAPMTLNPTTPTLLMKSKQMANVMIFYYLSDVIVILSGILIDVRLGLLEYTLYTIYPIVNHGTWSISAIMMS